MHSISNLNKFKDSQQVVENFSKFCLIRKKKFKDLGGIFKQIILPQDSYHKHLSY
jgi:hypothetical protein